MKTRESWWKIIIGLLIMGAIFLRFWQLGRVPPGLNRDGASIGYTAYSLLKTGRDEYGRRWPLTFRSFGDWKQPAYIYLAIPFLLIFGLKESAVLLPSALAGLAGIGLIYLLVKQIFADKNLARWAAVFLAILPWHFHFSRYNHEVNLGFTCLLAATWLFFKGLKKPALWPLAGLLFGLSLFTYHGFLVLTPLLVACLAVVYFRELKKFPRQTFFSLLILAFLAALIYQSAFSGAKVKASISFLNDPVTIHAQIELPRTAKGNTLWSRLVYNRPIVFTKLFVKNYLATFGPNFLAIKGGSHPLHNFPGMGNIFWWQYPLFWLGVSLLAKQKQKSRWLILGWLIISPLASSLTKDAPNSGRVFPMIFPLVVCLALGASQIQQSLKKPKFVFELLILTLLGFSLIKMYQNYFIDLPRLRALNWGAGYQQLVNELGQEKNLARKVLMSRPDYSPYIYFLFYQQFDPREFQKTVVYYPTTPDGFNHVRSFDRYEFGDFQLADELHKNQLVVIWAEEINDQALQKAAAFLQQTIVDQGEPRFYLFSGQKQVNNPSG